MTMISGKFHMRLPLLATAGRAVILGAFLFFAYSPLHAEYAVSETRPGEYEPATMTSVLLQRNAAASVTALRIGNANQAVHAARSVVPTAFALPDRPSVLAPSPAPRCAEGQVLNPLGTTCVQRGTLYVIDRWPPSVKVALFDDGYGLSAQDKNNLTLLINSLPIAHLTGLPPIVIRPQKSNKSGKPSEPAIYQDPATGAWVIERDRPLDHWTWQSTLSGDLAFVVGQHVYDQVLTAEERAGWQPLVESSLGLKLDSSPQVNFGYAYAGHVRNGLFSVGFRIDNAVALGERLKPQYPGDTPGTFVLGTQDPVRYLAPSLFLTSLFKTPQGFVPFHRIEPNGRFTTTYGPLRWTADRLQVGPHTLVIRNGVVVGKITPAGMVTFNEPQTLPSWILKRLQS